MDPCLPSADQDVLILTAALNVAAQATFDQLRTAYFPAERNWLDAHVTLFHALPATLLRPHLGLLCAAASALGRPRFVAPAPYKLGFGVAIAIDCPPLAQARSELQRALQSADLAVPLTAQDRHRGRLHVTVQNKVSREDALRSFQAISNAWNSEFAGQVQGLTLWHYQGGPWEPLLSWPAGAAALG